MNIFIAILVFAILSAILGACIGLCAKVFKVEEDPRIEKILSMLPGANCGGCGHPGCSGMAAAIVEENADPTNCKPCKADQVQKIKEYYKTHTDVNGKYLNNEVNN